MAGLEIVLEVAAVDANAIRGGKKPLALVEALASICNLAEASGLRVPIPTCPKVVEVKYKIRAAMQKNLKDVI